MASQQRAAAPKPSVSYQGHGHHLSVIEEGPPGPPLLPRCSRCSNDICEGPYFCCPKCDDFHLHLHCGPLPLTLECKAHYHPLELADTIVEDDTGEYYCDICEQTRDPRDCVYYCSYCTLISHLKCVYTEVVSTLKGESGNFELRTVGVRIPGRVVTEDGKGKSVAEGEDNHGGGSKDEGSRTLKEIFKSLSEVELNQFRELCPSPEPENSIAASEESEGVIKEVIPYSDEGFRRLLEDLDSARVSWEMLLGFFNMESRVVPVQGQEVAIKFADVWGQLTNKYGKFGAGSTLSGQLKIFVATLLCDVVHEMSKTGLNDVTEEKLMSWWTKLRVVRRGGFKVQFAIDHLTKVVCAYFGGEAMRSAMTKAAEMGEKADRVEEEIRSLEEKLKELNGRHKELNDRREEYVSEWESSKSSVMKRCLEEASDFRLGKASKGLIP